MPTLAEQWDADVSPELRGLNPDLADRLQQAKDAYKKQYGKDMAITSGYRTKAQQAELASKPNKYPVARPGTSLHESGDAVDIGKDIPDEFLKQYGLHRPLGAKDPVHVTLAPQKNASFADLWEQTPNPTDETPKTVTEKEQAVKSNETVENTIQQAFDLKKKMQGLAASGADVRAGAPSMIASTVGYAVPRALSGVSHLIHKITGGPENLLTPEETQAAANRVAAPLSQPVGKLTGMAETPEYKQALPSQVMDYIGSHINEGAEAIAKRTGVPVQDVQAAINGLMLAAPLGVKGVAKATTLGVKGVAETIKPWMQDLEIQRQGKANTQVMPQSGLQSGGAAATELPTTIQAELANAPEHIKQNYANIPENQLTPADLKYIQTHKLFGKFNDSPTEGQALQDARIMSEEYNNRNKEENKPLQEKFAQSDAKVISALEDTKQKITPDVHEVTPQAAANLALEKMVATDEAHKASINKDYKKLADANGGELPLDVNGIVNNADIALKKARIVTPKTSFLPKSIEDILDELRPETKDGIVVKEAQPVTYDDYLNYIKILNNEYRKATAANDSNAAFGIKLVRDAFENTDMVGKTAEVNALAKIAKANAKSRFDKLDPKSDKFIPAYQAAVEGDVRTEAEKLANTQHPAANQFIDKFYGNKTPEVYLNRLLEEIGRNTPEHQGLNAALLEGLKSRAGIKGTQGKPSQAAINTFINDPVKGYASNLTTMLGPENLKELQDFADYARLKDHTAISGNYANVSKSGMIVNAGPIGQAFEKGTSLAESALEHAINYQTGLPAGTLAKSFFKGKAEKKAAEELKAQQQAKLQQTLQPKPPSKLSDIGKQP